MKKIVIAIFAALSLSSCNDWLDVSSSTQIKGDDLFSSEAGFQDALTGIYLNMASTDLYGKNLTWYFTELMVEPYYDREISQDAYYIMNGDNYANSKSESYREKIWNKAYNTIANINNEIKALDEEDGVLGKRAKELFYGELYALRAYIHLDLIRLYGYGDFQNREDFAERLTIPYVANYSKELTEQQTYSATMALLIDDLKTAISHLSEDPIRTGETSSSDFNSDGFWNNRKYHLNYYAAQALLARAYMWEGSEESRAEAVKLAKEVIAAENTAYTWNTYAASNSTVDRTFSTEHLFTLDVYDLHSAISSFYTDLTYNSSAETLIMPWSSVAYYIFNAYAYNWDTEGYEPYFGYDDLRFQLHNRETYLDASQYYYCYKFYQTSSYDTYKYRNMLPMIKISEMYYILAEDYLLAEDNDNALAAINTVRSHRGLSTELTQSMIDDELGTSVRTEFIKELMREFVGEGQLVYYLKRWNVTSYNDEGIYVDSDRDLNDKVYVLPYPQDEITIGNRVQ